MATALLPTAVQEEINKLSELSKKGPIAADQLEQLVRSAIEEYQRTLEQETVEPLKLDKLKAAIYQRFKVKNTKELKHSAQFKMAADGMEELDFSRKQTWEMLYRKFIGILPHERKSEGYGCINGVDIFKYFHPWQVFDLDSKTATADEAKKAFRQLSKVYHPDNQETGDRAIFERLEKMYKSLIAGIS